MKKITFLCVFLFVASATNIFAQDRDLNTLLNDLKEIGNTVPISEKQAIERFFNANEQALILNHFAEQTVTSNGNSTTVNRGGLPYYVQNVRTGGVFGTLESTPPFDMINPIVDPLSVTCFADDFIDDTTYYALSYNSDVDPAESAFNSIDITDGTVTMIADISATISNGVPSGLSYNHLTETMYALSGNTLYEVLLDSGALLEVGPLVNTTTSIWLVIDNAGLAYAADIGTDNLYSVDLTTGVATEIGPLGVDISFAQDATVNPETNEIIMAAYTGGGTGGIYTVDPLTGAATLVGDTQPLNAEFGMFSVAGAPDIAGVDENQLSDVRMFPNPSNGGTVNIQSRTSGDMQVAVYDILGKQVINTVTTGDLNVSSLKAGVYMVNITQQGSSATKKLVIK